MSNKINKQLSRSLYCLIESFIYSSLVYLIFFILTPFKYHFLELNLHPLLIVVAIISVRYGTYLSSFAVIFSTFFYFLAYIKIERDPVLFFANFEYYKFILMFFFTALLVGKLRDTTDEKKLHMETEINTLKKNYNKQKRNNIKMSFINNRLKKQIINSKESIITLHHITSLMENMGVEEIFTKSTLNIKQFIDCDEISIYSYQSNKSFSRLKLSVGKRRLPPSFQIEEGSPHYQVIQSLEAKEFPLEVTGINPVYIAPILSHKEVVGFINIERLSFEVQERYTFEMFKIISHWLNRALAKAIDLEEEERRDNSYSGTRILKIDYFNKRLEEEIKRKKSFNLEFLAFEGINKNLSPKVVEEMIIGRVRDVDVVGMNDKFIRFIFPATEGKNKELLLIKLKETFEGVDFYEI